MSGKKMSSDYEEKDYVSKVPVFDGDKENWPFYKKKMESYIARSDLGELLDKTTGESVLEDGDTLSSDADTAKAQKELQKKNRKAAGILLNSITTTDAKGQSAFYLIEKFHNAAVGFTGGHDHNKYCITFRLSNKRTMLNSK